MALREHEPNAPLVPLTVAALAFASYAVWGRVGFRLGRGHGEPGATGLNRRLPAAQLRVLLLMVLALVVLTFLAMSHRL